MMKTATIEVFHVWGTMNTTGVQVKYRGKTLLTRTIKLENQGHNCALSFCSICAFVHTYECQLFINVM